MTARRCGAQGALVLTCVFLLSAAPAALYEAIDVALRLAVEAILAHDASLALALEPPSPLPGASSDLWHVLYGWARDLLEGGPDASVGPDPRPIVLNFHAHPFLKLQQRSPPRGAFLVSFHNPLHWLLGSLVLTAVLDRPDTCVDAGVDPPPPPPPPPPQPPLPTHVPAFLSPSPINPACRCRFDLTSIMAASSVDNLKSILRVVEPPLSVFVLNAQIAAGLWRRNGFAIRDQNYHYVGVTLRDRTYAFDLLLLQMAACILQPDHMLRLIVEQFELLDWFFSVPLAPFEQSQSLLLAEECLQLIICTCHRPRRVGRGCLGAH